MDDMEQATTLAAVEVTHTRVLSDLGDLTVVGRDGAVVGLYFPHHWYRPDPASFGLHSDTGFETVRAQIGEYLAGERKEFDVPVATNGDEYQERVWVTGSPDPLRRDDHLR